MTTLEQRALATLPMTPDAIETVYLNAHRHPLADRTRDLQRVCVSHERLRAELQGAEALLADAVKPALSPTSDVLADNLLTELDQIARTECRYEYGLPLYDPGLAKLKAVVRNYFARAVHLAIGSPTPPGD